MHRNLTQTIAQQHQTLERWRNQAKLNAEDMASEMVRAFRRGTQEDIGDSFYWDMADFVPLGCTSRLGESFNEAIEQHFARSYKTLATQIAPLLVRQEDAPYIHRTEFDALRRQVGLIVDDEGFKRALEKAKPSFFENLTSPDIMDDGYDEWQQKHAARVIDALNDHAASLEPKIARSIEKILLDAADEYEGSLRELDNTQQAQAVEAMHD
ncbi:MAG TPA: hypothetical protein ENO09_00900 [bacterium]|nr:hypothetical protein [bacterium]